MEVLEPWIVAAVLCMARLAALFAVTPFLSPKVLTGMLRNTVVLALAILICPAIYAQSATELHFSLGMVLVIGKEVLLGLLLGYLISLVFWAALSVGFIADNQRGASMAQEADPLSGEQSSPTGNMIFQTLAVLFYSTGGFIVFLGLLFDSYLAWPVMSFFPRLDAAAFLPFFFGQVDMFMYGVILLASPVLLACFLVDFFMGMVNRFAPQLNVFFMAMPIKSALSGLLLIMYWGVLFQLLRERLSSQMLLVPLIEKLGSAVSG